MKTDILIASLMVLASIGALGYIMAVIARAVRDEPKQVKTRETAAVWRPTPGW